MTIVKGQILNPAGRPVGSKNKYTKIKEMICDIVERRFGEVNDMDLKDLLKFVSATAPKETKIEMDQPIVIKWQDETESCSTDSGEQTEDTLPAK